MKTRAGTIQFRSWQTPAVPYSILREWQNRAIVMSIDKVVAEYHEIRQPARQAWL